MLTARRHGRVFFSLLRRVLLLSSLSLVACGDGSSLRSGEHELSLRLSAAEPQQPALRYSVVAGDRLQLRLWSPKAQIVRWSDAGPDHGSDQSAGIRLQPQQWHTLSRTIDQKANDQETTLELLSEDNGRSLLVLTVESA